MLTRITNKDLEDCLYTIHTLTKTKYTLDSAYGGIKAVQLPGYRDFLNTGFTTKREVYNRLTAFIAGLVVAGREHEGV